MNYVKIPLLIFMISTTGFSANEFSEVRKRIDTLRPILDKAILKSESIYPKFIEPSQEVTVEECEAIRAEVEKNYPISPFKAKYAGGTNYSVFCGTEASRFSIGPIYFDKVSIRSNFLREASWQLSFFQKNKNGYGFGGYLINQNYELIEAFYFQLAIENNLNSKTHFSIWSLDDNNNYFAQSSDLSKGSEKTESIQHYISSDLNYQVFKVNQWIKVDNKFEFLQTEDYKWAESTDWDAGYLIPTHAWTNPFFKYDMQLKREMKNSNRWVVNIFEKKKCETIYIIRNFETENQMECVNRD